jgi:hypothetical protein
MRKDIAEAFLINKKRFILVGFPCFIINRTESYLPQLRKFKLSRQALTDSEEVLMKDLNTSVT